MCSVPIPPSAMTCLTLAKLGSKRRLNPTWRITSACSTTANACCMAAISSARGFSQNICLPATAAWMISGRCDGAGEQIKIASIVESLKMHCTSSPVTATGRAFSQFVSRLISATVLRFIWGIWRMIFSAWSLPIRPAPIMPTQIGFSL